MLIDTHSHLYDEVFDEDRLQVMERARDVGVAHVLLSNVDATTVLPMKRTNEIDRTFFSMAMGLHPTSVERDYESVLSSLEGELQVGDYKAIGEIGLDYYWSTDFQHEQEQVFRRQIEWSLYYKLPMIIHSRKSFAEIFSILNEYKGSELRGVFHCFGGGIEEAKKCLSMGFYLGIGGVLTYKNSGLREIVKQVGMEKLLLETDAPYLPPVPYRGRRNEPAYMNEVAMLMGELLCESVHSVGEKTSENAQSLFNIW